MNLLKLQALLTGSFITTTEQPAASGNVPGFRVHGQEAYEWGGALQGMRKPKLKRKRHGHRHSTRYTYPGYNDGTEGFQRKRHETDYGEYDQEDQSKMRDFNFRERELIGDPHIELKRSLDSDMARFAEQKEPLMERKEEDYGDYKDDPGFPVIEAQATTPPQPLPIEAQAATQGEALAEASVLRGMAEADKGFDVEAAVREQTAGWAPTEQAPIQIGSEQPDDIEAAIQGQIATWGEEPKRTAEDVEAPP